MEGRKKAVLALIVVVILMGAGIFAYYQLVYKKDDDGPDTNGDDDADDDVGDDDDDDDYVPPDRPHAVISAPDKAYQYFEVAFDGSRSTDPDGLALTYSWDFDNDGFEDADTAEATFAFQELGSRLVTLAVENTEGRTDTESVSIEIVEGTGHPQHENLTLDEGNDGAIYRKAVGSSDVLKHWTMPADVVRVEATLYWSTPDWELRLTLGKGDSPDTGTTLVDDSADQGPLTITYRKNDDSVLDQGQWFLRIGILNEAKHQPVIEQCEYTIGLRVYYAEPPPL